MCAIAVTSSVLLQSTQLDVPVLPALARQLGADASGMAVTLSAALMTLLLLQFFSSVLAARYGLRRVLVCGALLGGISSLLCAVIDHWQLLLILRILGGAADAVVMPALLGLTAEIARGWHGAFFGILRSSQGFSFIIAPVIGCWASLWGFRARFVADGLLSMMASVILALAVGEHKPLIGSGRRASQLWQLRSIFTDRRAYAFALF